MNHHLEREAEFDPTGPEVRVLVVDDHEGYRSIVDEVIAATPGFVSAGSTSSWAETREQIGAGTIVADLVLMDVNLGDESGIVAATELGTLSPESVVILISTLSIADLPPEARTCGAAGFVTKSELGPAKIARIWQGASDWAQP